MIKESIILITAERFQMYKFVGLEMLAFCVYLKLSKAVVNTRKQKEIQVQKNSAIFINKDMIHFQAKTQLPFLHNASSPLLPHSLPSDYS